MTNLPRILIVEDETIVAMDIAATLRRLGYEVVGMVGTGAAAIETAGSVRPDLILMDIRLKGPMDGIEAAAVIQTRSATPIVFLTAHADADTVERAKAASPYGYLVKPFDERVLHRAVEIALQRVAADKSARDETLDALWQSEERFRQLVDAVRDYAIFMLDLHGRIATWNSGAERMTGFSAEDVLGESITFLRPPDAGVENLEAILARVRRDGSYEWDDLGIRKDGSRYLPHVYCTSMLNRAGELLGYACITRDVTEQRSLQAQLAQAQKLESLGQLAGGVAHDFNNMLMVIFARCDILLRQVESTKHKQFVADIRSAAARNRELTQQLLAAARQQILEPRVVSLNEVITSAMRLLTPTVSEQITIQTELEEALWSVYADPGKLHQVLLNLVINSRDAMPGGGTLIIESRNVQIEPEYARQRIGLREGGYVSLVVSDSGTGIPPEILERIYDPFFTTKAPGLGTGLGLAVVRGIVEQTGGQIWVYSELGRGTTFKLFFPRHAADANHDLAPEEAIPERGRETILLVENEDLLRSVVRETLEEQGYRVLEAHTAAAALTLSASFEEPIHLLLTDVIMPGMTGTELAETLVVTRPGIPVIFMSGYSRNAVMNHTTLSGEVHYLEKPIMTAVLLRTIRAALDKV